MIYPQDYPDTHLIYSKNNCVKCRMTKNVFDKHQIPYMEVNIEGPHMDVYIDFLKNDTEFLTMPVVFPSKASGQSSFSDFRLDNIRKLKKE